MSKKNDGGPAFPVSVRRNETFMDEAGYSRARTVQTLEGGMTLRDVFAIAALQGLLMNKDLAPNEARKDLKGADRYAWQAWILADAMLKAREKE